jgi:hypothetical protein
MYVYLQEMSDAHITPISSHLQSELNQHLSGVNTTSIEMKEILVIGGTGAQGLPVVKGAY